MKNNTILIAIGKNCAERELSKKLEEARNLSGHAAILIIGQTPPYPVFAYGSPAYTAAIIPEEWQQAVSEEGAALKAKAEAVEKVLALHDVSGDVTTICCEPALIPDAVARRAMLCDLAIVTRDLRETPDIFRQVTYGLLFHSPIGAILPDANDDDVMTPKRVFVAWNTSLQTARAVHQALPILRNADEVTIATIDPVMTEHRDGQNPGSDVAKWLTHHGCNVVVKQYPSGGLGIGTCIIERSKECGTDLVVMGAYGHSRLRESVFGGTTRTLIEQSDQAVFLAH